MLQQLEETVQSWVAILGCSVDIEKDVCTACTPVNDSNPWWLAFSGACNNL